MRHGKPRMAVALGAMVFTVGLGSAGAQHQHGAGAPSPHELVERCTTDFEQTVASGRGAGLAFAADQNGYPGPLHVLELKDRLKLTAEQDAKVQAMLAAMFAESKPKSARLLDAEAKLRQLFASGQANEAAVRAAVVEIEKARTEVRLVHLMFHLKTRDVLTDEQRRLYHETRWSAHAPIK